MGTKERWKVYGNVFDVFTIQILQKLSTQGYFEELESSLSLGKEANIFSAKRKDGTRIIVKIYRLQNCNFNAMFNYIKSDPRYANLHGQKRRIIFEWVRREFRNLLKSREVGVRVPTPIHFLNNVILMEYIGDENGIADQVKNSEIIDTEKFVADVITQMKKMYTDAGLVHADLSMFNILVHNQLPVFIDMSQTTAKDDPHAKEYLLRDCVNISSLAKRLGVSVDSQELFDEIVVKK
jgi:RIO kinase 1